MAARSWRLVSSINRAKHLPSDQFPVQQPGNAGLLFGGLVGRKRQPGRPPRPLLQPPKPGLLLGRGHLGHCL